MWRYTCGYHQDPVEQKPIPQLKDAANVAAMDRSERAAKDAHTTIGAQTRLPTGVRGKLIRAAALLHAPQTSAKSGLRGQQVRVHGSCRWRFQSRHQGRIRNRRRTVLKR